MLLYAKTQEEITPDCVYTIGGNKIGAKTLDLNRDFKHIASALDSLAFKFLGISLKYE